MSTRQPRTPLPPGCRRIPVELSVAAEVGQHLDAVNLAQQMLSVAFKVARASANAQGQHQLLGVELDAKRARAALIVRDVPAEQTAPAPPAAPAP